jgi:lactoylglutathione lyase
MAVKGFSHIGICVRDLGVFTRFYTEVLGFEELFTSISTTNSWQPWNGPADLRPESCAATTCASNCCGGQTGDGERRPMNSIGLTHLAFRVDTIDEPNDIARRAGGRAWPDTLSTVSGLGIGGGAIQNVYLTDPDGVRIECMTGTPDFAAM